MAETLISGQYVPEDFGKILSQFSEWATKQCPEEWKSILSEAGLSLSGYLINTKYFLSKISELDKLTNLINAGRTNTVKDVTDLLKNVDIKGLCKETFCKLTCSDTTALSNSDSKKDEILKLLTDKKQSRANTCIFISSLQSAVVIAIEFYSVYNVWNELKNAENIIEESKKGIYIIQSKINELKTKVDKLKQCVDSCIKHETMDEETKKNVMNVIRIDISSMRGDLRKIRTMIESIKVKLNNGIDTIGKCGSNQEVRAWASFGQAIGSGIQFACVAANATTPFIILQLGITLSFFGLTALNANNKICCDETVKKFREVIEEVTKLDDIVNELEENIEMAENIAKKYFENKIPDEIRSLLKM